MRQSTQRRAPGPVRPAAAALSKVLSRAWSLPAQRNFVAVERNLQVPMSGNGQVTGLAKDFLMTRYDIGLSAADPSALVLSAVGQTTGKAAAHA